MFNFFSNNKKNKPLVLTTKKPFRKITKRELLKLESKIGSELFGKIPKGHDRSFFNLDEKNWIWYEEWTDKNGKKQKITTRYEIRKNDIIKVMPGPRYVKLEGEELKNLKNAISIYNDRVMREVYGRDPKTGIKIS
jgi:hypothetical protein